METFDFDVILFLVNGILMIALTLVFGFALTVKQVRASAEKPEAVSVETSSGRSARWKKRKSKI